MWKRVWQRVVQTVRRDFVAGLLVFVPVGFTILGVLWILDRLDKLILPAVFRAIGLEGQNPRFVGVLVTVIVILLAGALTRSFLGRSLIRFWEGTIDRIPVARSLYAVLKQFMQAIFGDGDIGQGSFDRVVVIEYPRKGLYTYAFVTGRQNRPIAPGVPAGLIKVFVSSTPNPTTGYYLLVREDETIETTLTVEEAFKLIVSAGIADVDAPVAPDARDGREP